MLPLFRFLVGYRDDLELSSRWWHRLLKVVFTIFLLIVTPVATWIIHEAYTRPAPILANVTVVTTQRDFMAGTAGGEFNTTPGFLALPGELGQIKESRIEWIYSGDVEKRICTADAYKHIDELVRLINKDPGDQGIQTVESTMKLLKEAGVTDRACYTPTGLELPDPEHVVKYRFTARASVGGWAGAIGYGVVLASALWLFCSNLYHRGLVYIIRGPRKRSERVQAPSELM